MTEGNEGSAQQEETAGDGTPFDEDPPVDPSEAQVGNSKARFFVPRDEETGEAEEGQGEGEGNE
jgi:hypothetical protein